MSDSTAISKEEETLSPINHFQLVFDRGANRLREVTEFRGDLGAAIEAYATAEDRHRANDRIDIVLVGAGSLESVRVTHSTYFEQPESDAFAVRAASLARFSCEDHPTT